MPIDSQEHLHPQPGGVVPGSADGCLPACILCVVCFALGDGDDHVGRGLGCQTSLAA